MSPSEYLLLVKVQASLAESMEKSICQPKKYDFTIKNHVQLQNHTFVLSRMTKRRVVFRGLNNRIMTYKRNIDEVIEPIG